MALKSHESEYDFVIDDTQISHDQKHSTDSDMDYENYIDI